MTRRLPRQRRRRGTSVAQAEVFAGRHEQLIIGRHALAEVLRASPDRIVRVLVAVGEARGRKDALLQALGEAGIEVREASRHELASLVGSEAHQSFVTVVRERTQLDLTGLLASTAGATRSLMLLLDEIHDPHNLGAILRVAECFGCDAVVLPRHRGAGISPVVSKTSAGASELVTVVSVSNLVDAMRKLKSAGYWLAAADAGEGGVALSGFEAPPRLGVVLGSEGAGLHRLALEEADFRVKIPLLGRIESLNVAQAAAVMLYEFRRQWSLS